MRKPAPSPRPGTIATNRNGGYGSRLSPPVAPIIASIEPTPISRSISSPRERARVGSTTGRPRFPFNRHSVTPPSVVATQVPPPTGSRGDNTRTPPKVRHTGGSPGARDLCSSRLVTSRYAGLRPGSEMIETVHTQSDSTTRRLVVKRRRGLAELIADLQPELRRDRLHHRVVMDRVVRRKRQLASQRRSEHRINAIR